MTAPRLISGLSEIAPGYDALICDVWGVIHDGHKAHPEAAEALTRFREKHGPVVLLTNAPRMPGKWPPNAPNMACRKAAMTPSSVPAAPPMTNWPGGRKSGLCHFTI